MTVYKGSISTTDVGGVRLDTGDYITSPSSVHYAILNPNGSFAVSRGSDPVTSGANVIWSTPDLSAKGYTNPFFVFYNVGQGTIFAQQGDVGEVGFVFGSLQNISAATFSLGDNGAITIHQGADPNNLGRQIYSNNVNDPVVGYDLTGITYDLANPTIKTNQQISSGVFKTDNGTATEQTYPVGITLDYTKTSSWDFSLSEAVALGVKSTFDVGVPGIGDVEAEISLTSTTTISKGKGASESESKQYGAGATVTVPAFTTYQTVITGTTETYDVPFTYTGLVTYQSGASANVNGKGMFSGGDTGVFDIQTTCVSAPNGCPAPPGGGVAVPEPNALSLLPAVLLASVAVRRLRTRPGRQAMS